jgi:hypothetical protein
MAERTITRIPPAPVAAPRVADRSGCGVALSLRAVLFALLATVTVSMAGKAQAGGGPSIASSIGATLTGGPARNHDLLFLTLAALALLGALAIVPVKK